MNSLSSAQLSPAVKKLSLICLFLIGFIPAIFNVGAATDVTVSVETLGKPSLKGPYASNIWDMQIFDGRIYIGHGNSSNYTPESNSGAVPILSLDPASGEFVTESVANDEQIDLLTVINGKLYSPSHDPTGTDSTGFYTRDAAGWSEIRSTVVRAYHSYDLSYFANKLYIAVGAYSGSTSQVNMTPDDGVTWGTNPDTGRILCGRSFALVQLDGALYSLGYIHSRNSPHAPYSPVSMFNGTNWTFRDDLVWEKLFPGTNYITNGITPQTQSDIDALSGKISRHGIYNNKLIYIGGYEWNDHQCFPFGLYVATSLAYGGIQVQKAALPSGDIPWDILVRSNGVYVLTSQKISSPSESYIIKVHASTDLVTWTEQFRFIQPTFARSFEELDGDFYFGLGTDYGPDSGAGASFGIYHSYTATINSASGTILRVRDAAWNPAAPCGLAVTSQKPTAVSFSWNAPAAFPNVAGYFIYVNGVKIASVTGHSYSNAALTPGSDYDFTVQAYDRSGGVSDLSAPLHVKAYVWKGLCERDWDNNRFPDDWVVRTWASLDTTSSRSGNGSLKITGPVSGVYLYALNFPALKTSGSYKATAWIRTQGVTSGSGIAIREVQTAPSNYVWSSSSMKSEGTWAQISLNFTTSNFTSGLFEICADLGAGVAWVDDVVITEVPGDNMAPSVPAMPVSLAQTTDSVALSWNLSTDNVGVAGYYVNRDGVRIAEVGGTAYSDGGLASGTAYQYSIEAYDAAGNVSDPSPLLNVSTVRQTVTIYQNNFEGATPLAEFTIGTSTHGSVLVVDDPLHPGNHALKISDVSTTGAVTASVDNIAARYADTDIRRFTITADFMIASGNPGQGWSILRTQWAPTPASTAVKDAVYGYYGPNLRLADGNGTGGYTTPPANQHALAADTWYRLEYCIDFNSSIYNYTYTKSDTGEVIGIGSGLRFLWNTDLAANPATALSRISLNTFSSSACTVYYDNLMVEGNP